MQEVVETTKMSTKGQVIIPKEIRDFTDSEEDTIFTVVPLDKKTIVLRKLDKRKILKEFRTLRSKVRDKVSLKEVNAIVHKVR